MTKENAKDYGREYYSLKINDKTVLSNLTSAVFYVTDVNTKDKQMEIWALRNYAPAAIEAFLNSNLMHDLKKENGFEKRCFIGYILQQKKDLNDGQRQKILAEYLRYTNIR